MAKSNRELDSKKQRDSQSSKKTTLPRRNKTGKKPISIDRWRQLVRAAGATRRRGVIPALSLSSRVGTRSSGGQRIVVGNPRNPLSGIAYGGKDKRGSSNPSKSASSGKRNPIRNKKVRNPK